MKQNQSGETALATEPRHQPAAPPSALARLDDFIGDWKAEGESFPSGGLAGRMHTSDSYEWLPGGFHLVQRGELCVEGHDPIHHLWIFGWDTDVGAILIRAFDGMGHYREYLATVQERTWTFTGETERGTIAFDEERNRYRSTWEIRKDDDWRPLCELDGTRVG